MRNPVHMLLNLLMVLKLLVKDAMGQLSTLQSSMDNKWKSWQAISMFEENTVMAS